MLFAAFCILLLPASALAQAAAPGTFDLAAGVRWTGRMALGASSATETAPDGTRFQLFASRTTLAPATGVEGNIGVRLTRLVEAGVSTSYTASDLRTRISSDAEGAPDVTAGESVKQLAIEGSLVVHFVNWHISERAIPFVSAGAGYLRHLHQDRTLVETGRIYHVGGGLSYLLRTRRRGATGVRLDARAVLRTGGAAFDDDAHVAPAFGSSLFLRF